MRATQILLSITILFVWSAIAQADEPPTPRIPPGVLMMLADHERRLDALEGKPQTTVRGHEILRGLDCPCPDGPCICGPDCKCPNCPEHGKPALRAAYEAEVKALAQIREGLDGDAESIARRLHAARREIGEKYKNLTPADLREEIYARNVSVYGDPLGPSIDWLRGKGKTWEQIAESASDPGDWPPKGKEATGRKCLVFTATWCGPCKPAANNRKAAGLVEGVDYTLHDFDEEKELAAKYHVTSIPALVRLNEDGTFTESIYVGATFQADEIKKWNSGKAHAAGAGRTREQTTDSAPAVLDSRVETSNRRVESPGYHSHTCKSCGAVWSHGEEAAGNPRAHNCPRCGRYEDEISGYPANRSPVVQIQPRSGYWQTQCGQGGCRQVWVSR